MITDMDRVLVAYASRMGSTREIAAAIGEQLRCAGVEVDVCPVLRAKSPRGYAAVILGSAVYFRRWDKSAVQYLKNQAPDLAERPVWLFQSGPVGDEVSPQLLTAPPKVAKLASQIGIRHPVSVFGGNLDPTRAKGRLHTWVARSELAQDSRDWDVICAWADDVAHELRDGGLGILEPDGSSLDSV